MAERVSIGDMSAAINEALVEYADLATEDMKKAVKRAGRKVRKEIQENAPVRTGAYAKSWTVKTVKENANSLSLTVHSRDRYYLAHLLEFGHAKRGGGRVSGQAHIAPAEDKGIRQLTEEIERSLSRG
ncbi:MAG: HK97 gp10 family phage protein [Lachnospiraceae bacterium]|nr:HK97 gp10 family phage protein [Lachnospiraceae bacterium]MBQ8233159.1 HK97 gp10 family phage protein [Lachnospiraceae bacterium]